jgi:cell wall-associated NlpC family hydrolase
MTPPVLPPGPLPPVPPGTTALDPRRNAYRDDLAADSLRGLIEAPRYVTGAPAQIARASVPVRKLPFASACFETEALFGEHVTVYDVTEGWAWVQLEADQYVGYLPADTLTANIKPATHRVKAIGTFVYAVPDIKSPPMMHLSLNAQLAVAESIDRFYHLATGGYVIARHVAEIDWRDRDFVEVAERLTGTPYLWGGRSRIGLDCSALVQLSLMACGIAAPRDSDMQRAELGTAVELPADLDVLLSATGGPDDLQRGDLLFWPGHVGIMGDAIMLLHANAHHMAVAIEPLPEALARITATGSELRAIRRMTGIVGV